MSRPTEWVQPPRLATGEERSASRLELFYDLAYVLVVAELGHAFLTHMDWVGTLAFAGLFTALWFSWVSTTLYANRFDTDDVVFRIAQLVNTAATAGCAAAAAGATGPTAVPFALCFTVGRATLFALYLRAWRHVPDKRPTITVYLGSTGTATVLWAVSAAVPGSTRYVLWAVAVVVEALAPFVATWRGDTAPLHLEHLPERFGLFVILVLGEVVAAIGTGVLGSGWAGPSLAVAAVGFVIGASLWWTYFDAAAVSPNEELRESPEDDVDERHDLYIYGHLPLTLGVAAAGVGIEDLVLHPDTALPAPHGWAVVGGVALCLLGSGIVLAGVHQRVAAMWPWPFAALPALAVLAVLPVPALVLVALVALVTVAVAVTGSLRQVRASAGRG